MLLASGYPPNSIFRPHLLPLHLESTIPTSPPYAPSPRVHDPDKSPLRPFVPATVSPSPSTRFAGLVPH